MIKTFFSISKTIYVSLLVREKIKTFVNYQVLKKGNDILQEGKKSSICILQPFSHNFFQLSTTFFSFTKKVKTTFIFFISASYDTNTILNSNLWALSSALLPKKNSKKREEESPVSFKAQLYVAKSFPTRRRRWPTPPPPTFARPSSLTAFLLSSPL